jgi:hypothetical protein
MDMAKKKPIISKTLARKIAVLERDIKEQKVILPKPIFEN